MILVNRKERTRFLRFALVGTLGAVVDFTVFNLLSGLLGMHAVLASMISFCAAVASNFTWNRLWTFPDSRSKPVHRQLVQFVLVNLAGLAIRTPIFALLEGPLQQVFEPFGPSLPLAPISIGHNLALAAAILVVMLWNYFANRHWTYNDVE